MRCCAAPTLSGPADGTVPNNSTFSSSSSPRCPSPRSTAARPVRALERAEAETLGAGARPVHRAGARHRGGAALSGSAPALGRSVAAPRGVGRGDRAQPTEAAQRLEASSGASRFPSQRAAGAATAPHAARHVQDALYAARRLAASRCGRPPPRAGCVASSAGEGSPLAGDAGMPQGCFQGCAKVHMALFVVFGIVTSGLLVRLADRRVLSEALFTRMGGEAIIPDLADLIISNFVHTPARD